MSILREGPDKPRYRPRNYRIISHRTQRRILHIEDALELERIRLEMWDYSKGAGAKGNVEAVCVLSSGVDSLALPGE
jgi:hypothetical protein